MFYSDAYFAIGGNIADKTDDFLSTTLILLLWKTDVCARRLRMLFCRMIAAVEKDIRFLPL